MNIVYCFYVNFLHLRLTQKALQLPFFFFLFFFPVTDFAYISTFVTQDGVTRIRLLLLDALANVFVKATVIVKFQMCEYDIPCALEKILIADLSALLTWSFKIISSPPAQSSGHENCYDGDLPGLLPIKLYDLLIMTFCQVT